MTRSFQVLFLLLKTVSLQVSAVRPSIVPFLLPGLFIFSCTLFSHAQISQPNRFELIQGNSTDAFNLISLKEEGLALIWDREHYKEGKKIWKVSLLDTTLTERHTLDLPLESRYKLIGHEYVKNWVFLLFRSGESDSDYLHMVQIHLITHELKKSDIKHQFNLRLTHFSIVGDHALLGGYVVHEPAVMLYEMSTNQVKVVPGFFLTDTELLDLRVNVNNTFNAVLVDRGKRENKNLMVRTYDEGGTLIMEDIIDIKDDLSVIAAQTSGLKRDEMMVLGTYGEPKSKQAIGFFAVAIDPFNKQSVRYFDFAQFDHFLDYMTPSRSSKIKTKAQHDRESGKIPSLRLYVQPVRIEESEQGFVMISEVYQPTSSMTTYPYWNNYYNPGIYPYGYYSPTSRYYNSPYSPSMSQHSDYKMMETAVTLFDAQGTFVWDHSLKLPDIHSPSLDQVGDFLLMGDRTLIAYKSESDISTKIRYNHDQVAAEDTVKIALKNPTDAVRHETKDDGALRYWYNKCFYAWGFQSIKDRAKESDQLRYVFYINKIKVD